MMEYIEPVKIILGFATGVAVEALLKYYKDEDIRELVVLAGLLATILEYLFGKDPTGMAVNVAAPFIAGACAYHWLANRK